jgi:hypothetical protein
MKVPNLIALLLLLMASCHQNSKNVSAPVDTVNKVVKVPRFIRGISIITLIANPEKYEGDTVMVAGFLNLEFEGNALYIHKEDYEHRMSKNSIWVDIDRDSLKLSKINKYNKKYVEIEGVFSQGEGHMSACSGSVKITSSIYIMPSGDVRPPKEKKDQIRFPPPSK